MLSQHFRMATEFARPTPPSSDKRWKMVDTTMRRLGNDSNALIESLHAAKQAFGCLDRSALEYIAASLNVPLSKAHGVAAFYQLFDEQPAAHNCVVCTGINCYLKGSCKVLKSMETAYGVTPGDATPNGEFKVTTARCLGACGFGPAAAFDDAVVKKVTPRDALKRLAKWKKPQ
jgi:bidirectional [NiFe] hydrogenase diaphorase subunit